MTKSPRNKNVKPGHHLEKAVKFIQQTVLESDPKLKGTGFSVETNKIVIISGVRHEIDVLVKTLQGSIYESTSVFECKDWKKPVGKQAVVLLTDKVNAIHANHGFLVARSITRDAEAQLKLDGRLSFIPCTEDFLNPLSMEIFHEIHDVLQRVTVNIKQRGVPPEKHPPQLDWQKKVFRWNNQVVDFVSYIGNHIDNVIAQDKDDNRAKYSHESTHWGEPSVLIRFEPREFTMDDNDIEHIVLKVNFWVSIHKQKLISKFELKGHGRAFTFEPIEDDVSGKQVEITVVQRI